MSKHKKRGLKPEPCVIPIWGDCKTNKLAKEIEKLQHVWWGNEQVNEMSGKRDLKMCEIKDLQMGTLACITLVGPM